MAPDQESKYSLVVRSSYRSEHPNLSNSNKFQNPGPPSINKQELKKRLLNINHANAPEPKHPNLKFPAPESAKMKKKFRMKSISKSSMFKKKSRGLNLDYNNYVHDNKPGQREELEDIAAFIASGRARAKMEDPMSFPVEARKFGNIYSCRSLERNRSGRLLDKKNSKFKMVSSKKIHLNPGQETRRGKYSFFSGQRSSTETNNVILLNLIDKEKEKNKIKKKGLAREEDADDRKKETIHEVSNDNSEFIKNNKAKYSIESQDFIDMFSKQVNSKKNLRKPENLKLLGSEGNSKEAWDGRRVMYKSFTPKNVFSQKGPQNSRTKNTTYQFKLDYLSLNPKNKRNFYKKKKKRKQVTINGNKGNFLSSSQVKKPKKTKRASSRLLANKADPKKQAKNKFETSSISKKTISIDKIKPQIEGNYKSARRKKSVTRASYLTVFSFKKDARAINFLKPFDEHDIRFYKKRKWKKKRIEKYHRRNEEMIRLFYLAQEKNAQKMRPGCEIIPEVDESNFKSPKEKTPSPDRLPRSGEYQMEDSGSRAKLKGKPEAAREAAQDARECSFRNLSFGQNNSKISINITVNSINKSNIQNNIIIKTDSLKDVLEPVKSSKKRKQRKRSVKKARRKSKFHSIPRNSQNLQEKAETAEMTPTKKLVNFSTASKSKEMNSPDFRGSGIKDNPFLDSKSQDDKLFDKISNSEQKPRSSDLKSESPKKDHIERNDNKLINKRRRQKTRSMYQGEFENILQEINPKRRKSRRNKSTRLCQESEKEFPINIIKKSASKTNNLISIKDASNAKLKKKRSSRSVIKAKKSQKQLVPNKKEKKDSTKKTKQRKKRKKIRKSSTNRLLPAKSTKNIDKPSEKKSGQKRERGSRKMPKKQKDDPTPSLSDNKAPTKKQATTSKQSKSETKKQPEQNTKNEKSKAPSSIISIFDPKYNNLKRSLQIKIMKSSLQGKCPSTTKCFYDIQKELGSGSYAKVNLGVSILCGHQVALKIYEKTKSTTEQAIKRIYAEMKILRRMSHPNIVNFIEIFETPARVFTVMEYVRGSDLLKLLINKGHFSEKRFRAILQQIVEGLEYIHGHKILHRDVKLDNILLSSAGKVKICDFGISKKMRPGKLVFEHIGTPAYLAPEIILEAGYSGFAADVWSLGVMSYMALTGKVPFKGNNIKELQQSILHSKVVFPSKPALSSEMKRAIRGMLEKDPQRRFDLKEVVRILGFPAVIGPANKVNFMDEAIIQEIKSFGFDDAMIRKSLRCDDINHITALYKLLKFKLN